MTKEKKPIWPDIKWETEFRATPRLRFVERTIKATDAPRRLLQQQFYRVGYDAKGDGVAEQIEWRDVPLEPETGPMARRW